jgi:hypothetical protein
VQTPLGKAEHPVNVMWNKPNVLLASVVPVPVAAVHWR